MNFDKDSKYVKKDLRHGLTGLMPGDVILVRTVKDNPFMALIGFLIRKISNSWENHAALYMGSGRHEVIEALIQGVKKTKFENFMNDKTQLKIFRNKNLTIIKLSLLKAYAYGAVGRAYAVGDLKDFVFDDGKNDTEKSFCSELVVEAYNCAGIKSSAKFPRKTSPGDLYKFFKSKAGKTKGWILHDTRNVIEP